MKNGRGLLNHIDSTRNMTADILRAVAIILVTWGHATNALFSGELSYYFPYKLISATFVMPLFMGISGYFAASSLKKESLSVFIKKRVMRILVPCIVWNILGELVNLFIAVLASKPLPNLSIMNIWFLWATFFCNIILLLQYKLCHKKSAWVVSTLVIWGLFMVVPNDIWHMAWVYPFFIIGYGMRSMPRWVAEHKWHIWGGMVLIYFLLLPFYKPEYLVYQSGSNLFAHGNVLEQLFINGFRFVVGVLGCVTISGFVEICLNTVSEGKSIAWLCKIGSLSMEIYVIQTIILEKVFVRMIRMIPPVSDYLLSNLDFTCYIAGPLVTASTVVMCVGIKRICKRWKPLDLFLFGK